MARGHTIVAGAVVVLDLLIKEEGPAPPINNFEGKVNRYDETVQKRVIYQLLETVGD